MRLLIVVMLVTLVLVSACETTGKAFSPTQCNEPSDCPLGTFCEEGACIEKSERNLFPSKVTPQK